MAAVGTTPTWRDARPESALRGNAEVRLNGPPGQLLDPTRTGVGQNWRGAAAIPRQLRLMYAAPMSKGEVDKYLASLEQPKRGTLEALRRTILDIIPEAEQCISYGMPAFRVQGRVIAGFAAFKNHLSYLPHSGSVIPKLGDALSHYKTSSGALQFSIDRPLSKALVKKLIAIRKRQALGH
jgi:uncharacterized protein YdhG (YjbR/CyaY superfamily)